MAEHMLILGVESPEGEKNYVAAAFPSACGKTNFAMLIPPEHFKGWKITTVGDDIAWMQLGAGRAALRDQSGERLLRRRAGHELQVEPERDEVDPARHDLHERRADRRRRRLVGRQGRPAARACDRLEGQRLDAGLEGESRASEQPLHRADAQQSRARSRRRERRGVPISAIIFGGRRSDTMPLVFQAFNWEHGVYLGATMGSEMTAAAVGGVGPGAPRPDGDAAVLRLQHGRLLQALAQDRPAAQEPAAHLPRELVPQGRGRQVPLARLRRKHARPEVDRSTAAKAAAAPPRPTIGYIPRPEDFDLAGLEISRETMRELFSVKPDEWKKELEGQQEFFETLGADMPRRARRAQRDKLAARFRRIVPRPVRGFCVPASTRLHSAARFATRLASRIISGGSDKD